jgi:hypothetical protein
MNWTPTFVGVGMRESGAPPFRMSPSQSPPPAAGNPGTPEAFPALDFPAKWGCATRDDIRMPSKVIDMETRATDYRLNQLGVRVSKDVCQLISRVGEKWLPLGPVWQLPIRVPEEQGELAYAHSLGITAYQYCRACPESDLLDVLTLGRPCPLPGPMENCKHRFDLLDTIANHVRGRSLPPDDKGDPIAASRALIRSSRELLASRTKKPV